MAGTHVAAREEEEEVPVRAARVAVHVVPAVVQTGKAPSGAMMMVMLIGRRGIFCRVPIDMHVGEGHEDCMDCPHGHARTVTLTVAVTMRVISP